MADRQDEDDFDVSDDDSMIDRLICERNDVRVGINTMVIIENLSVINADLPNDLLLRVSIRDNSVVSSLIGSSGKVAGRRKGE